MAEHPASPRPFGLAADDLEIEFTNPDRPALVTAVLAACMAPHDTGHWWAQTVGTRHRALLDVLQRSEGPQPPSLVATCPACAERSEFELPLNELRAGTATDEPVQIDLSGRALCLRRPTGADLRAWRSRPAPGPTRGELLCDLVSTGDIRPGDEDLAARALADADPLVAFAVHCNCAQCGHAADHEVDLEALVLSRLAAHQHALMQQVHRLASRYGWTEAQVLAVAPMRRVQYLALIEAER